MRRRRATVATPGEWQCSGSIAVANGPNIFQMLLVDYMTFWCVLITACCDLVGRRVGGRGGGGLQWRAT